MTFNSLQFAAFLAAVLVYVTAVSLAYVLIGQVAKLARALDIPPSELLSAVK
jgi:hypothetical protein